MNLMSKGVLTAMTLALDFGAGAAMDNLWDAAWNIESIQQIVAPKTQTRSASKRTDQGLSVGSSKSNPGGGVCKPSERSVMVLEMSAMGSGKISIPNHVCIRAMSGEPVFSKASEFFPEFINGQ